MQCADSLRVQAYFDSEADALSSVDIERHLERCAECRALLADLQALRYAVRDAARDAVREAASLEPKSFTAPAGLRHRVLRALDDEVKERPLAPSWSGFWAGALSGVCGSALATGLAFFLLAPPRAAPLLGDLVDAHLRSLMPDHLIEVTSTDRHTVKPWFAGRADVSPTVADFSADGYGLVGGRTDYLDRQRAAVTVYRHGLHVINVFSWADSGALPRDSLRNGYRLVFWRSGDLAYCAVSDSGWDELHRLESLLRETGTQENKSMTAE